MAVVFSVRGDSLNARVGIGGTLGVTPAGGWTVTADGTAIGGSALVAASNNNQKALVWPGRYNTPNSRIVSMLMRIKTGYAGTPSASRPVMPFLAVGTGRVGRYETAHNTAGNIVCTAVNDAGTTAINAASFGAWSPGASTWYDLVLNTSGTTSAGSAEFFIDAVSLGTLTPTAAFSSSWANSWFSEIAIGGGVLSINPNAASIGEIVLFDTVINPSSVTLESGTGSLNGASRTSFVLAPPNGALAGNTYSRGRVVNKC